MQFSLKVNGTKPKLGYIKLGRRGYNLVHESQRTIWKTHRGVIGGLEKLIRIAPSSANVRKTVAIEPDFEFHKV